MKSDEKASRAKRSKEDDGTSAALRLENQLCFALYAASRAFTRAYQPLLEPLGLTYPQYLVMLVLWEGQALSVSELGARLALDSGTLTPLLKRLQEAGFVQRKRDADDERIVRLSLTPSGKALRARASGVPLSLACRAGFTPDARGLQELERMRKAVVALTERMNAAIDGGT